MPRNMSFAMTTQQMRDRTKTVTRRLGWKFIKAGDTVNAVVKAMGLKPGEEIERICQIKIKSVRWEPLRKMLDDEEYGWAETTAEGFPPGNPKHDPAVFVRMFCEAMGCTEDELITRIEFEYVD